MSIYLNFIEEAILFLNKYFVDPIRFYEGYNIINTIVYGSIFVILSFFVIYPILEKRGIKFNFNFATALLPYVFFFTGLRIFEDLGLIRRSPYPWEIGYYFVSPGIWILGSIITIFFLWLSLEISKRTGREHTKIFRNLGILVWFPVLISNLFLIKNLFEPLSTLIVFFISMTIIYIFLKKIKSRLLEDKLNLLVISAQMADGAITSTSIAFFGFKEIHVVGGILTEINPFLFLLLKVFIVITVLDYVDRKVENKNFVGFFKIVVMVLGLAPASRNFLQLLTY